MHDEYIDEHDDECSKMGRVKGVSWSPIGLVLRH